MKYKYIRKELILLIILLIGFSLRVIDLGSESLWYDEGGSLMYAKQNIPELLENVSSGDCSPPTYYVILHYWISAFGESEFSLRFLSVIFGFLSIYALYELGKLLFGKNVGLLSALILGISEYHIYYSQEARPYSLLVLLTILSFYYLVKVLKDKNFINLAGYLISSALLIYTHVFGIFVIVAQNVYLLAVFIFWRKTSNINLKEWILLQSILIIAYVPWIWYGFIKQMAFVETYHWYPVPHLGSIFNSFCAYAGSRSLLDIYILLFLTIIGFKIRVNGSTNKKGFFKIFNKPSVILESVNTNKLTLLSSWLFIPIIIPFLISQFATPIFVVRHTIVASAALYILVAKVIIDINNKYSKSGWIQYSIVGIIIIFSARSVTRNYVNTNEEEWREIVKYVDINGKPGDLIVLYPGDGNIMTIYNYYNKRRDFVEKPINYYLTPNNIKQLESFAQTYNRVWFLQRIKDQGIIDSTFNKSYNLLTRKIFTSKHLTHNNDPLEISLFKKEGDLKKILTQNKK